MRYTATDESVLFSQAKMPRMLFVTLFTLGVMVEPTGSKILPWQVRITESEFMSAIELSEEL